MRLKVLPALPLALALSLAALCAMAAPPAVPPAAAHSVEPDTRSMIEALMPSATRNLVVRQKAQEPAASAPAAAGSAATPTAVATAPASAPSAAASATGATVPPPSLALAIQFEPNSYRVRPESGAVLGSLVAALQSPELKTSRFVIEGHADPRGAAAHNLRLSQERADEVRLFLVSLGVHPARLRAVGKGASQLANANDPGAPENRRVRVVTVE